MALHPVSLALYTEQERHNSDLSEADRYQGRCVSHPHPVYSLREIAIRQIVFMIARPDAAATVNDTPLNNPTTYDGSVGAPYTSRAELPTHVQTAQTRAQKPPRDTSLNFVYVRTAMMTVVSKNSIHETPSSVGPKPP